MICSECNTKNTKNDNFCRNCGKKLGEEVKKNSESNNLQMFLKTAWNDIKGMVLKPLDTSKIFIKDDNYVTSLIYLSANILVIAISVLLLVKSIYGTFASLMGFNSLVGFGSLDSLYETVEIPYFRIFLMVIMTIVILYGAVCGVTYLICNYLFKSKTSFKKILTWIGINSVFNTVACLVVALGFLITPKLGTMFYLAGSLLYTYNLVKSIEYATDTDKNKLGYVLTISIMITLLVVVVILPKIFF